MNVRRAELLAVAVLAISVMIGCSTGKASTPGSGQASPTPPAFTLTSPDVGADGLVPVWAYGSYPGYCDGENRSLNLNWSGAPSGTKSFVLLLGNDSLLMQHWVVTDIPATATGLASAPQGKVTAGTLGRSIAGPGTYVGPCTKGIAYVYSLFALDTTLNGSNTTTLTDTLGLMNGHILSQATLTTQRA